MKRAMIGILTVAAVLVGCHKEELKLGQHYKVDGMTVKVRDVADSRCPIGADCITEGDATVYLNATDGKESHDFSLDLNGSGNPKDTVFFGYRIRLKDVTPFPDISDESTMKDNDKKVKLEIIKQ